MPDNRVRVALGLLAVLIAFLALYYFIPLSTPEVTTTTAYSTVSTATTTTAPLYPYLPSANLTSEGCTWVRTDFFGSDDYKVEVSGTADGPVGSSLDAAWVTPDGPWSFNNMTCGSWTYDEEYGQCVRNLTTQPNSTEWSAVSFYSPGSSVAEPSVYFSYSISYGAYDKSMKSPSVNCSK